ncbi:MAG: hypothetical protein HKO57_07340 [Akkermansiaceae bacterium]|nr:hypothetical protein [Akkermansiaceae bacterium]
MSNSDRHNDPAYEEAVRVLGFESGEAVEPHLPDLHRVEEKLEAMIEEAPDEEARESLRGELGRLSEALQTLEMGMPAGTVAPRVGPAVWAWAAVLLIGCFLGLGWIGNTWIAERRVTAHEQRIAGLLKEGDAALEKRRWPEAAEIYNAILELDPGYPGATNGLQRIEDGKVEERRQQIGFLAGSAQAAIEGRRWNEAESASRKLRALDPGNGKLAELVEKIATGRKVDRIVGLLDAANEAIREEDWERVSLHARQLEAVAPDHDDLPRLKKMAEEGMKLLAERRAKARELYKEALAMDNGTYSPEALEVLREALRLADRPEYQGLYDKISSYARTLEVPGEFKTVGEALAAARPKDKVRIAAGTYRESLIIPPEVELEGAGPGRSIFECDSAESSVVVVKSDSRGARLAGLTLQQAGIALTEERFPVVAVDGGELTIDNCHIENGSGHGVAVVNGGEVLLRDVRIKNCGWDGLAVYGEGSRGEARGCRFDENLHHGVDAWSGGKVSISKCRSSRNGLAGVVIMSPGVLSTVTGSTSDENRELGLLVSAGSAAELDGNQVSGNLLGGVFVRDAGTAVTLINNRITKNGTAGVVVDKRSKVLRYEDNTVSGNSGKQVDLKAEVGAGEASGSAPEEVPKVVPPPDVPEELESPEAAGEAPAPGDGEVPAPPGPLKTTDLSAE